MKTQEFPLGLYIVATPIGNLSDFSERGRSILSQVDWIAAEDTREAQKLLHHLGITKELISFHEHSDLDKCNTLLDKIMDGKSGAYVSDAGTPGISDPGAQLVNAAHDRGIRVIPVPGASALASIVSVSGFAATKITFHGFLPREGIEDYFSNWKSATHVFYESPHRVEASLEALAKVYPQARIVMAREMTKIYEEIWRGTTTEWHAHFQLKSESQKRGEYCFAVEILSAENSEVSEQELLELFKDLATLGANQKILLRVAEEKGVKRNLAYKLALQVLK